jgi:hypothetical protein
VNKKLVVVPEDADTVRTMFRLYLKCSSVGGLAEELGRRKIVSKVRTISNGRTQGGGPYSVGALAHFLKNRFYIGEVVYRGEVHAASTSLSSTAPPSMPCKQHSQRTFGRDGCASITRLRS